MEDSLTGRASRAHMPELVKAWEQHRNQLRLQRSKPKPPPCSMEEAANLHSQVYPYST